MASTAPGTMQWEGKRLVAASCPKCGAILSLKTGGQVRCDYCGSFFLLHEAYKQASDLVRNYYELAYAAQEANNADEAYKYFTMVLEQATSEPLAWFGKGIAALGRSTGLSINVDDAVTCFRRTLSYVEPADREKLKQTIASSSHYYADLIGQWLASRGWLDSARASKLFELYTFCDAECGLTVDQMKQVVVMLTKWKKLILGKAWIKYFASKIRQTEPKYLTPDQRNRRTCLIIVAIVVLLSVLLVVLTVFLAGSPSPK